MPRPAPASSCGAIVQATDASGSSARQAIPPATSTQPATARVAAGPRTKEPASAATGSTLTAAAAASGSTLQPLIRRRTRRKTTAVRAPESRARAIPARTSRGGRGSAAPARGAPARPDAPGEWPSPAAHGTGARSSTGTAARATGACAMKIARQSNSSVSSPPRAGPAAVPATAAPIQSRRPAPPPSSASKAAVRSAAPPSACSARSASSSSSDSALAQPIDAAPNSRAPAGPVQRPWSAAESGSASASTAV